MWRSITAPYRQDYASRGFIPEIAVPPELTRKGIPWVQVYKSL